MWRITVEVDACGSSMAANAAPGSSVEGAAREYQAIARVGSRIGGEQKAQLTSPCHRATGAIRRAISFATDAQAAENSPMRSSGIWGAALALAAVALLGWADWVSGVDYGFSLFYLVVIAWAANRLTPAAAWLCAFGSAIAWIAAELSLQREEVIGAVIWNGTTRLIIYSAAAWLLLELRADRAGLRELNLRLQEALEGQTRLARTDPLTGLANARSFNEALRAEIARAREAGEPVCLAYLDIDNFKELNDFYGHSAGDRALGRIAEALRSCVRSDGERPRDLAARVGGDEFAILFAGADAEGGRLVSVRVLERIAELAAEYPKADLGCSIGLSCSLGDLDAEELIRTADRAMYEAKAAGKGRVVVGR